MRVAVTGGSGMISRALLPAFAARGDAGVALRRGARVTNADWDPAASWIRDGALEGCEAVVHLAGASIGDAGWSKQRKRLLRHSRIEGMRTLLAHFAGLTPERRPRVFVAASAVGYEGDRGDEVLTETTTRGDGFLAELVEAWEAETAKAADLGMRVVQTRSGVVLARQGGAIKRMWLPFQLGVGGRLASGRQWMTWVSLEDGVRALLHVIDADVEGPVNVGQAVRNADFTKGLGCALRRPTVFPFPAFALKLLFGQMGEETLLVSQRISSAKLEASGFTFRQTDIDSGLDATLRG